MAEKVPIGQMAEAIMESLNKYKELAVSDMKKAVQKTAKSVKEDISSGAPKRTGAYAKSWTTKTTRETADCLEITVHSSNKYQLAHLLENGHAKRGGGRVAGRPHIAPAEQKGIREFEKEIERSLTDG